MPYFMIARQNNPYLGLRAHRVFQYHPEILEIQLNAILEASKYGPVRILYPMINTLEELDFLNGILAAVKNNYDTDVEVGIMVETPASVLMIDSLLQKVDFVSIGTNDLVQYTLTVDRNNEDVMHYYQPLNPAIIRMMRDVVSTAEAHGKLVSICGEIASDPRWTPLLIGLGIRSLSLTPPLLFTVKRTILSLHEQKCRELADNILAAKYESEIQSILNKFIYQSKSNQRPQYTLG